VILFLESGMVHGMKYSFSYFFLLVVLFTDFIVDIKSRAVSSTKPNHITLQ